MKFLFLATLFAFVATTCHGQDSYLDALRSAQLQGAEQNLRNQQENDRRQQEAAEQQARWNKAVETGKTIFGQDARWSLDKQSATRGTIADKNEFAIGDWGCSGQIFRTLNQVSKTECLVTNSTAPEKIASQILLIRGLDTSKVTDGAEFILQHPLVIHDTYSYGSLSGSRKTVLVLDCNDEILFNKKLEEAQAAAEAERKAAEDALYRTWSDDVKHNTFRAKFIDLDLQFQVHLELREPDTHPNFVMPFGSLSEADKDWIRAEMKRRRDADKTAKDAARKAKLAKH